ncbi:MAG TPA: diaminopimelate decarboxylase [Bacteroidaceae bacterium]|nr:diaminopimelate decarboxylase [Bacteroidaceae bacterium]
MQETPFYYYDISLLEETIQTVLSEAGKNSSYDLYYAIKANANPKLLSIIKDSGLGVDCVSGGEIQAAIDTGFSSDKIVFAGVGKSDQEIDLAIKHNISCFNVESAAEIMVLHERAVMAGKQIKIAIRVNPNIDAHTHSKITTGLSENKFGINIEQLDQTINLLLNMPAISLEGLHFHIGSQILDLEVFKELCKRINTLQEQLESKGVKFNHINVGGGLGTNYIEPEKYPISDFKNYFKTFRNNLVLKPAQRLRFELGRSIVAQCGKLITKVLYVKKGTTKQFVIVDAGMNDLIRPALYQASHKIINISSKNGSDVYDVVGPICESSDVFASNITLPITKRGDYLAILSAGAYGEVMSSQYNLRKLPLSYTSQEIKLL